MGAYLLAQAAPMIVSTGIWVVVVAVYPMMIVIGPVLGALALALRHTPPVLRVRFSVRPAVGRERALVLRALAAVPSLRGRGEPRIWVAPEPWDVIALGPRDLAVGAGVLDHVATDSSDPPLLARTAVSALAAQRLGAAAVRGLVDAYCLPWAMLKALGGRILDEFRLLSIWRVFVGLATRAVRRRVCPAGSRRSRVAGRGPTRLCRAYVCGSGSQAVLVGRSLAHSAGSDSGQ